MVVVFSVDAFGCTEGNGLIMVFRDVIDFADFFAGSKKERRSSRWDTINDGVVLVDPAIVAPFLIKLVDVGQNDRHRVGGLREAVT